MNAVIVVEKDKTARKTGKPRKILIGNHVAGIIAESISDQVSGHIFLDGNGNPWNVPRVSRILRKIRNQLQLPKEIVFYCN